MCLVLDATAPLGPGDASWRRGVPTDAVVVVNKVDIASPDQVLAQLRAAGELELSEYFPVSARDRRGRRRPRRRTSSRACPRARSYYPDDMVTDVPEAFWVAELVREQLLAVAREELPHSIATRVTEWEWPAHPLRDPRRARVAEGHRDRQGRPVLKEVGIAVREQLPAGRLPRAVREGRQGLAAPARAIERLY